MISRRQFFRFIAGLGAFGASTAAYGFGEPVLELRVTRYDIQPPQWPADFQLRIAAVADLHACDPWMSLERIGAIVERTNALNADVIVLLGDYVAGIRQVTRFIPASEWAAVLAGLKAPLGVHAILGNHDWWDDKTVQREGRGTIAARRALETAGIPVYENDARRLTKDGHGFWLAGLGDQLAYAPARRFRRVPRVGVDDLGATLRKATTRRSSSWPTSPTLRCVCRSGSLCNSRGIPMAGRCGCSGGRQWYPRVTETGWLTGTPEQIAMSSSPAASDAVSCRSALVCRPKSCW